MILFCWHLSVLRQEFYQYVENKVQMFSRMGVREIAEALALTETSSSNYKHKLPFPKPNKILSMKF